LKKLIQELGNNFKRKLNKKRNLYGFVNLARTQIEVKAYLFQIQYKASKLKSKRIKNIHLLYRNILKII
jgi:hypothetical protein